MALKVVILAAGQGKRMYSKTPKVLHKIAGEALLSRVVHTAESLHPQDIYIIYGHEGEIVRNNLSDLDVTWVHQNRQLGTGHALAKVLPHLDKNDHVLVLYGDVPFITIATLQRLIANHKIPGLSLLLATLEQPQGLGRIVRDDTADNAITAIVEERDATDQQRNIKEIFTGILLANACDLQRWLPNLSDNNQQQEYYLTDIIAMAVAEQSPIMSIQAASQVEITGVNSRQQLVELERNWQQHYAAELLNSGVTVVDPARFDVRGELVCDQDIIIDINCVFEGRVKLGKNVTVGPNCYLKNVEIASDVVIKPNSVIEDAVIGEHCEIGPFARMRPGCELASGVKVGNFVELKKSKIGKKSKVSHLSYVGDTLVGQQVNVGAGTITCNYDGVNKHQTIIEDGAFIGSDTQLIAPVVVGAGATIGAGSVISKDAPAEELTVTRAEQISISGWKRPKRIAPDDIN